MILNPALIARLGKLGALGHAHGIGPGPKRQICQNTWTHNLGHIRANIPIPLNVMLRGASTTSRTTMQRLHAASLATGSGFVLIHLAIRRTDTFIPPHVWESTFFVIIEPLGLS
jgi:hypothetical protein